MTFSQVAESFQHLSNMDTFVSAKVEHLSAVMDQWQAEVHTEQGPCWFTIIAELKTLVKPSAIKNFDSCGSTDI